LAALMLGLAVLAPRVAAATEWVERAYKPPVGSRWIIARSISKEQRKHENGVDSVSKRTISYTGELTIDGKTADGFRITYRRIKFAYDGEENRAEMLAALAALNNIAIHAVTDASGKPLRVENLDDIKRGLNRMIAALVVTHKDVQVALAARRLLAGMTRIDDKQAAEQYLDELPGLAMGQNTGLKIGEVRRAKVEEPNGIGPPLVKNTALTIAAADAANGKVHLRLTETYDADSVRRFVIALRKKAGDSNADDAKDMQITMEAATDIEVVDGMTRSLHEETTTSANFFGNTSVTKSRKDVTVTPAR
jgi:hypothetical protein